MISLRLLWRECLSGQLSLLAMALVISVAAMTTTAVLTDRIDRAMQQDAAALLGGDLKIRGPRPLDSALATQAQNLGLARTDTVEFPSVVGQGDRFELAGIKVVTEGYPLRGELKISTDRTDPGFVTKGIPEPGKAWADGQLASKLDLEVGDRVSVGETTLEISHILMFEPDRGGAFTSFSPRLMMNRADLEATALIQPGSRVRYITLLAGEKAGQFREAVEPNLDISQRISGVVDGRPEVGGALNRATAYLSLAGLLTVLLSGAAIAMTATRWATDHINDSALFRTFGLTGGQTLRVFTLELGVLATLASGFGVAIGYAIQVLLVDSIAGLLTIALPPPSALPAALGMLTGFVVLFGFAGPALWMLGQVPPIRILKRDFQVGGLGRGLRYGLALFSLAVLGYLYSGDFQLTAYVVLAAVILCVVVIGLGRLVMGALAPLEKLGTAWRFGMQQLIRDPETSGGQLMAFAFTALAISMVALIRFDLIATWEAQVPTDAPNTFALNITPAEGEAFSASVRDLGGSLAPLYPIVRGRLETVNGIPLIDHLKGAEPPGSVRRELSLTEASVLGRDNQVDRGRWFVESDPVGLVSVESELLDELGLKLGDVLHFQMGPDVIEAEIIGTRTVRWESMLPNFFMIFSPGTLAPFESTQLTSLRLPNPIADTTTLARTFRQVTLLSVDAILDQVRSILGKVSQAVSVVLYFVLVGGVLVLAASIQTSLPERRREAAILRSLGGSDRLISQSQWAEFLTLGVVSGLLSALGTEILGYVLYTQLFELQWQSLWQVWVILPVANGLLVGTIGRWSARQARMLPPATLLKAIEA